MLYFVPFSSLIINFLCFVFCGLLLITSQLVVVSLDPVFRLFIMLCDRKLFFGGGILFRLFCVFSVLRVQVCTCGPGVHRGQLREHRCHKLCSFQRLYHRSY